MNRPSFHTRIVQKVAELLTRKARAAFVAEVLARASLCHAARIKSYTSKGELHALLELALGCRPGARALEVGTYLGASACHIAAGLREGGGTLTCVDTWQNETMPDGTKDTFAEFQANVAPIRGSLNVIRKPSALLSADDVEPPLDYVFLDGDHTYASTRRDFETVTPWLADDGVIALHDLQYFEGVSRVVGEALAAGQWSLEGHFQNLCWLRRAKFVYASDYVMPIGNT